MAYKVTVAYHPELTPADAIDIFRKHFSGEYNVHKMRRTMARDFIICKSTLVGVRVKLEQEEGKTSFIFDGDAPNALAALFFWMFLFIIPAMVIYLIVLKPKLRAMEAEVKSYIENAPEFK
jgi:hypothetical protein